MNRIAANGLAGRPLTLRPPILRRPDAGSSYAAPSAIDQNAQVAPGHWDLNARLSEGQGLQPLPVPIFYSIQP